MKRSTCFGCHTLKDPSRGPPYGEVAKRYVQDPAAAERLAQKIITGGTGVWGGAIMVPNPQHTADETRLMVRWILSLAGDQSKALVPGATGRFKAIAHPRPGDEAGVYVLTANYTDSGVIHEKAKNEDGYVRPLTGEAVRVLRARKVEAEAFDGQSDVRVVEAHDAGDGEALADVDAGDHVSFKDIDLAGITHLTFRVTSAKGARIEARLDSVTGPRVAEAVVPATGEGRKWQDVTVPVAAGRPPGAHAIFFVFGAAAPEQKALLNLNWIRFDAK